MTQSLSFQIGKVRRIKQARDEAQAEIENYRKERERQFKEYENLHLGSRDDVAAKIDKNTEQLMIKMEEEVKTNAESVILLIFIIQHPQYHFIQF